MERQILEQYKNLNIKIINYIKNDEDCLVLIEEREELNKKITSGKYKKNILKNIYQEYDLYELDKCLEYVTNSKLKETKHAINKSAQSRQIIKGYNSTINNENFYSVKI